MISTAGKGGGESLDMARSTPSLISFPVTEPCFGGEVLCSCVSRNREQDTDNQK